MRKTLILLCGLLSVGCHRDLTLCPEGSSYAACVVDAGPETQEAGPTCDGVSLAESCGKCGSRSRTCTNGIVSDWGACAGEGPCTPTEEKRTSGTCAGPEETRWARCSTTCSWQEECRPEKGWRKIADSKGVLSARRYARAVWTGKVFLVWGGYRVTTSGNLSTNDGAMYDPAADSWTAITPPPANVDLLMSTWAGTKIFAWGGGATGDVGATYDLSTDKWTLLPAAPLTPRLGMHTAVWMPASGEVLVSFGYGAAGTCSDAAAFDLAARTWRKVPDLPAVYPAFPRYTGWTGSEATLADPAKTVVFDRYTPATNKWNALEVDLPADVGIVGGALNSEGLFVFGPKGSAEWRWDGGWLVFAGFGSLLKPGAYASTWIHDGSAYLWWPNDGVPQAGGARVSLSTFKWEALPSTNEPAPRTDPARTQSEHTFFVWGGGGADGKDLDTGAIYTP